MLRTLRRLSEAPEWSHLIMMEMRISSFAALLSAALYATVSRSASAQSAAGSIRLGVRFVRDSFKTSNALALHSQLVQSDVTWKTVENRKGWCGDLTTALGCVTEISFLGCVRP